MSNIIPKPHIAPTGAAGYLLWLRRDLPPVYQRVVKQFPQVAQFESAIRSHGLGDDMLPEIDVTAPSGDPTPITVDFSSDLSTPLLVSSDMFVSAPALPAVDTSAAAAPAAAQAAAAVTPSALSAIGSFVQAVLPGAITAGAAVAGAVIKNKTAVIANQTAQLQYAAAVAGGSPYQTGIVTAPNGTQYLAPIQGGSILPGIVDASGNILGVPWWIWAAGAVGVMVVAS